MTHEEAMNDDFQVPNGFLPSDKKQSTMTQNTQGGIARYTTVKISGVITCVAKETEVPGYTEAVVSAQFPTDIELNSWSEKKLGEWIKENNRRMKLICDLLNKDEYARLLSLPHPPCRQNDETISANQ